MAQTSLNSTGVASSGALSLQSNGTTEAIGISTSQVATFVKDAVVQGLTVGRGAGAVSTNTAVGASALAANTTGTRAVAVGYEALKLNTTGDRNHAFGLGALGANVDGNYNSAVGYAALGSNTSGSNNVAMGYTALNVNTTASLNTAVGYQALVANTTGNNNDAFGAYALKSNLTGAQNVAVGQSALEFNTASNNTALGHGAAGVNTSGTSITALGRATLVANTTGSYNTGVGMQALASNTTASNNTAVGYQAGYSNTAANQTFVGYKAGYATTTGQQNIAVGQEALSANTTGVGSVAMGAGALLSATTANYNTGIGYGAGSAITTGAKNTILGAYSGNQGGLDIRTASNYIVLSDGDGNPRQIIASNGHAFINTASDFGGYLNIVHSTAGDNALVIRTSSGTYTSASQVFQNSSGGNAGYIQITGASSVSYVTTSDYRLKENIAPMTGALSKVAALNPVTYTWKEDGIATQGFIAHELQAVVPECVVGEKDAVDANGNPKYQGIDTSFLVATLTAAIQELKAEFDAYKATHP